MSFELVSMDQKITDDYQKPTQEVYLDAMKAVGKTHRRTEVAIRLAENMAIAPDERDSLIKFPDLTQPTRSLIRQDAPLAARPITTMHIEFSEGSYRWVIASPESIVKSLYLDVSQSRRERRQLRTHSEEFEVRFWDFDSNAARKDWRRACTEDRITLLKR